MTRPPIGLIDQINYVSRHGAPMPDDRIGILQERIARENRDAGVTEYQPPGASMYVPFSVLNQRDLSAGAQGGAVVETTVKPEIEAFLYPFSAVVKLGATVLDGLKGNVEIPIGRASLPVAWNSSETGPAVEADPTVGSFSMTPHIISSNIAVSRSLLVQSPGVESWIKREIGLAIGSEVDRIALLGSGSSQPTGIFNTPTAQTITFGGAATFAKAVLFETLAGQANARRENLAWIVGNNTRSKWRQATRGTTAGNVSYLFNDDHTIFGYRAEATSKLDATNQVVMGDFQEAYLGSWGADALHLVVDNVTQAKVGKVIITATCFCDVAFRRPNLFVTSTDSAAV